MGMSDRQFLLLVSTQIALMSFFATMFYVSSKYDDKTGFMILLVGIAAFLVYVIFLFNKSNQENNVVGVEKCLK